MKIDKLNLNGKKDSIEVLDKIFSAKVNKKLVDTVLYKTNANYKGRHAKTKQQNEVAGPTSMPHESDRAGKVENSNVVYSIRGTIRLVILVWRIMPSASLGIAFKRSSSFVS